MLAITTHLFGQSYLTAFVEKWLPMIDHFVDEHGRHMVHADIRHAVCGVRNNLNLPNDNWPAIPIHERTTSAQLRPRLPPVVDHLGHDTDE